MKKIRSYVYLGKLLINMSKLVVFAIAILVGVVVNISVLYAIVLGLRTEVAGLNAQVSQLSATQKDEKSEDAPSTSQETNTVSSGSAESTCVDCRRDIDQIKQTLSKITPASGTSFTSVPVGASAREFFVPLGSGKTKAYEWEDIAGMSATIDSRNYTGIKSVSFEISLRIPTANGTVYARLFNKTDGHPVWNSDVSSEGPTALLKTANNITLDSGEKAYQVQMRNSLQYESIADSARMKIVLQ